MGAHDRQGRVQPARRQRFDFGERTGRHHRNETIIDALPEHRPLDTEESGGAGLHRKGGRATSIGLPVRERAAGCQKDLERTQHALRIVGPQPGGGFRINRAQPFVQRGSWKAFSFAANTAANGIGHGGNVGETLRQCLEVEARAADDDRQEPLGLGRGDRRERGITPACDGEIHRSVDRAVELMRCGGKVGCVGAGGDDREVAIDLHGIGVDHDPAEAPGEGDRQRRLAAGGRTCDENGLPFGSLSRTCGLAHVVTLVSHPADRAVGPAVVAAVAASLPAAGAAVTLSPGVAVDIPFASAAVVDNRAIADGLRVALAGAPVDVFVQVAATRRKRLFLADMDSTMIGQECIDELADKVGVKAHVAAITERAMRGEIDFEPALRERVALLKGLPAAVVDEVIAERITLTSGGRTLVRTMRANGTYTALVSGGFTLFTGPVHTMLGFDEHRSNVLVVEGQRFAGRVEEPILGREAKLAALLELRDRLGLDPIETMAIGDGANDLAMIGEAGLGVAYRAKPKVAEAAGARIDHADLTALLYAQGYRDADFVT